MATVTKQDRVMNYLTRGKTLSQTSAASMFQVGNLRATISDVKPMLRTKGYDVVRTAGRNGETRYGVTRRTSRRSRR